MDPQISKRTSRKSRTSSSVIGRTRSVTMPTVFFLPDVINRLCLSPACSFFAPCRMGFSLFFSTRMEKTPIQTKEREIPLFHHPSLYHCYCITFRAAMQPLFLPFVGFQRKNNAFLFFSSVFSFFQDYLYRHGSNSPILVIAPSANKSHSSNFHRFPDKQTPGGIRKAEASFRKPAQRNTLP